MGTGGWGFLSPSPGAWDYPSDGEKRIGEEGEMVCNGGDIRVAMERAVAMAQRTRRWAGVVTLWPVSDGRVALTATPPHEGGFTTIPGGVEERGEGYVTVAARDLQDIPTGPVTLRLSSGGLWVGNTFLPRVVANHRPIPKPEVCVYVDRALMREGLDSVAFLVRSDNPPPYQDFWVSAGEALEFAGTDGRYLVVRRFSIQTEHLAVRFPRGFLAYVRKASAPTVGIGKGGGYVYLLTGPDVLYRQSAPPDLLQYRDIMPTRFTAEATVALRPLHAALKSLAGGDKAVVVLDSDGVRVEQGSASIAVGGQVRKPGRVKVSALATRFLERAVRLGDSADIRVGGPTFIISVGNYFLWGMSEA